MPQSSFYDAGLLRQIATNLFYGWGYNFYRTENMLRADDQIVRTKAAWLLGTAMTSVSKAETDYRREFLPAPTRAKPFPEPEAVASTQKLERLARDIGALEGFIQQLPVPENDRMTQRYRLEAPTLKVLIDHDLKLVGQCETLRAMVHEQGGAGILKVADELQTGLNAIRETLRERENVLHSPA
ncbi:MAG TPA: hypothetical protein VME86_09270 [Acidobacteriaceae bacterium]|nr:hypothetical protein [Acidobacteriaceae bacterium]